MEVRMEIRRPKFTIRNKSDVRIPEGSCRCLCGRSWRLSAFGFLSSFVIASVFRSSLSRCAYQAYIPLTAAAHESKAVLFSALFLGPDRHGARRARWLFHPRKQAAAISVVRLLAQF